MFGYLLNVSSKGNACPKIGGKHINLSSKLYNTIFIIVFIIAGIIGPSEIKCNVFYIIISICGAQSFIHQSPLLFI